MQEFWYDNLKAKYAEKQKSCYKDTDSCIVYTKAKDINIYIAGDIEKRFYTSNYELVRPLPKGKYKKNNCFKKNDEIWRKHNDKDLLH